MHEPRNYGAVRATERTAQTERDFVDVAREETVPTERPTPAVDHQVQEVEPPNLTDQDRHEAERAALTAELDAQVRADKITHHERRYQLYKFEISGLSPKNDAAAGHEQRCTTTRGLGRTDRADMVSQQAAARERLNQATGRAATGQVPEQAPELLRKPFEIEL